jgi:eight-cysteine-cluster-containing protein
MKDLRSFILACLVSLVAACGGGIGGSPGEGQPISGPGTDQPVVAPACQITGCSGHVCAAAGEDIVTTCEWLEEYACYRTASCEVQADGRCGWTQTDELRSCLE